MQDLERIRIAYKKLKASIYYDKTQLPLRDRVVLFEKEGIEEKITELKTALMDGEKWDEYEKDILNQIGILLYPKSLNPIADDTAIFNADSIPVEMKAPQYFLDLPVQGHILGVLWVLSIGYKLDKNCAENNPSGMYEHSYGNRLRKTLYNEESEDYTYSPGLFEPYFAQYESWRDYGLERAKERLNDKQDAIILTLDFKSFYYSVHMDEEFFPGFLERVTGKQPWHDRLNQFVYNVLFRYSDLLRSNLREDSSVQIGQRIILPIGFLPSNILANWVLTGFDDAIIEKWNPVYYGRYVDDIIIVDKVEKNSGLYKKARDTKPEARLTTDDVIDEFLTKTNILEIVPNEETLGAKECADCQDRKKQKVMYKIHSSVPRCKDGDITVQGKKVKLFYFQSGSTQALLNCFKTKIAQNASEFRLLPDMEAVIKNRNYSEIFDLRNEEGINKFRGVTGIELDKFALSKFLGKYRKVSSMIESREENEFEKDLMLILDERTLIANYGTWERLLEILLMNERYDLYKKLSIRIIDAIEKYSVPTKEQGESISSHDALLRVFLSALHRTAAVAWSPSIERALIAVSERMGKIENKERFARTTLDLFNVEDMRATRIAYCETRMVNKYLIPLPIDCVLSGLGKEMANLSKLRDLLSIMDTSWASNAASMGYKYYPYMVLPQDISFALLFEGLLSGAENFMPDEHQKRVNSLFVGMNYPLSDCGDRYIFGLKDIVVDVFPEKVAARNLYYTKVACEENMVTNKLKIAVGSVALSLRDFDAVLDGRPNRGYNRYKQLAKVFDEAIEQKANVLVLPESYLPIEWVPSIARLCANNQIALITGIEHFVVHGNEEMGSNGQIYNLTAIILPYQYDDYKFAHISYHNKVAYAPFEISEIEARRYAYKEGNEYQLFGWKNIWFPVYCCFELASIKDRAIFQEYADMVVAVEWNKDVPYYSNIIESLTRDLHCYCVQVNSSEYGDSRIIAPKDSASKDIVKTKGGENSGILIGTVDIKALRDFQMWEFAQQKADGSFKPSPPGRNPDNITQRKRQNKLFETAKNSPL